MKKSAIVLGVMALVLFLFLLSVPVVNDRVADQTAERVKKITLPTDTQYVESFSRAGKLVGNGNGMQYLGGILIRSDLSLEELQAYYAQYAQNEEECVVERQTDNDIGFVEHGTVSLNTGIEGDHYFIVYTWGSNDTILGAFDLFDLRGH